MAILGVGCVYLGDLEAGVGHGVPHHGHDLGGELPLLLPGCVHILIMCCIAWLIATSSSWWLMTNMLAMVDSIKHRQCGQTWALRMQVCRRRSMWGGTRGREAPSIATQSLVFVVSQSEHLGEERLPDARPLLLHQLTRHPPPTSCQPGQSGGGKFLSIWALIRLGQVEKWGGVGLCWRGTMSRNSPLPKHFPCPVLLFLFATFVISYSSLSVK